MEMLTTRATWSSRGQGPVLRVTQHYADVALLLRCACDASGAGLCSVAGRQSEVALVVPSQRFRPRKIPMYPVRNAALLPPSYWPRGMLRRRRAKSPTKATTAMSPHTPFRTIRPTRSTKKAARSATRWAAHASTQMLATASIALTAALTLAAATRSSAWHLLHKQLQSLDKLQ